MIYSLLSRGGKLIAGQLGAQLISMVGVFLCVRMLPKAEFGVYVVIGAIQAMLSISLDLQTSTALTTLGAKQKFKLGDIVAACRFIRIKNLLLISISALIVIGYILSIQFDYSIIRIFFLWIVILVTGWAQQSVAIHLQVLAIEKNSDLIAVYQFTMALGRLGLTVFALLLVPTVESVLLAFLISAYLGSFILGRRLAGLYDLTGTVRVDIVEDIRNFIRPMVLPTLAFAVQGNLWTILIGGGGAATVLAEVGALNRLAQIFPLMAVINNPILLPALARSHMRGGFKRVAVALTVGAFLGAGVILFSAYIWHSWFLRLLGDQYIGLSYELFVVMLAAAITYGAGLVYMLLLSRSETRFQYLSVPIVVGLQIIWYIFLGLDTTRDATGFLLVTAIGTFLFQCGLFLLTLRRSFV